MRALPRWLVSYGVTALVLVGASAVLAEQGGAPSDDDEAALEQEAVLSPAQQRAWAGEQAQDMEELATRLQALLDDARRDRDIIKVTCLNDKLTQLGANIRSFQGRIDQHEAAVREGNEELRDHLYRLMVILEQRTQNLRLEAEACVGESDVVFGRTSVEVDVDSRITDDDPTLVPPVDFIFDRPPAASGYY